MKCAELMTRNPVICKPGDSISYAAELMRSSDIGAVPIVRGNKLVCIVTDRDIAIRATAEVRNPTRTPVGEIMTRKIIFCHEDEEVGLALELMAEQAVRWLPIVERGGKLVGLIGLDDIAPKLPFERVGELVTRVSKTNASMSYPARHKRKTGELRPEPFCRTPYRGENLDEIC